MNFDIGIHFTIAILILFEPWTAAIDIPLEHLNHPNKFCGPLSSCAEVDQIVAEAEAETGKHQTEWRSCQCDDRCVEYGDCCADAKRFEEQRNAAARYNCMATDTEDGTYAVAKCPATWTDARVRDACQEVVENRDGMVGNPVTSRTTGHTYRNRFCAACNRDAADPILWGTRIVCADLTDVDADHEQLVLDTLRYNETGGGWWTVSYGGEEYACKPAVVRPATAPVRPCLPDTVVTCHPQWPNNTIRSDCEGYTTVLYDHLDRPYRNIHCAMCNNVPVQNLKCKQSEQVFRIHSKSSGRSFSALFFVQLGNLKCSNPDTFYDPLFKTCRTGGDLVNSRVMDNEKPDRYVVLTYVGLGVSTVLLVVHLAVFTALPEMKNLSGKNLASFCVSLVCSYAAFVTNNWLTGPACYAGAAFTYYAFLTSFTWMSAMSFDCWRTLRLATVELRVTGGRQTRKFLVYSAVCWLVPAMATMVALAADSVPAVPEYVRPRFDEGHCWFGSKTALLLFFIGPLTAIMATNVMLFGWTAYMIHSSRATVRHVNTRHVRRDFRMYCRLAVLMGLTWTTGLVAKYTDAKYMWLLFVALNTFQGLFVFVAFTCRRRVLDSLLHGFGCAGGRLGKVMSLKKPPAGDGDNYSGGPPISSYTWPSSENGVPISSDKKTTDTFY